MVERLTTKRRVIVVSTFMEIPCFLRLPGKIGERFSGVFQFERSLGDDLMEVSLVGANLQILIPWLPCQGRFTIYDAVILETVPLFLSLDDQSFYVPHEGCSDSFQVKGVCRDRRTWNWRHPDGDSSDCSLGLQFIGLRPFAVEPVRQGQHSLPRSGRRFRQRCITFAWGHSELHFGCWISLSAALHSRTEGRFSGPTSSGFH